MTRDEWLNDLQKKVDKLKSLLDDKQEGLITWWSFLNTNVDDMYKHLEIWVKGTL